MNAVVNDMSTRWKIDEDTVQMRCKRINERESRQYVENTLHFQPSANASHDISVSLFLAPAFSSVAPSSSRLHSLACRRRRASSSSPGSIHRRRSKRMLPVHLRSVDQGEMQVMSRGIVLVWGRSLRMRAWTDTPTHADLSKERSRKRTFSKPFACRSLFNFTSDSSRLLSQ